jgi:serine/threonine-protein kinase
MDNTDKYIGQLLDNRYEILERIGMGGMAIVYKARCHRLNRLVAVKILKEELAEDADFRRRFRTESQAVAMLSHPNIVAVYDVSRSGNIEYIVMELIEGITLKQYINRKGLLNWKEALHFATQVAKALSHAHSRGIIHRDIKPHNIMILKDGSVKVADFGIARLQSTQNTLTQEALGSVHYISPEQAKGSHVDARSDIYSLGVVMYEMLTSHLPFEGDSAVSIAIQHISAIPLMPREVNPDIPAGLESITMHAMEPDLNMRYATTDELLADLEEFRKNPAANFSYYVNDTSPVGRRVTDQATREVPTAAIIKAESTLPKTMRTPSRRAELTKDDYRKSAKRSSTAATLVGIFLIIIFLIAVFIFMWPIIKDWFVPSETYVDIPNFIGKKYSDIVDKKDSGDESLKYFEFKTEEQYDDTVKTGFVIMQDPSQHPHTKVPSSNVIEITLTVSKGKEPEVTMPDLFNMDYRDAKNALMTLSQEKNLDLTVQDEEIPNEDITEEHVIETKPAKDEPLAKGMTIYITWSSGPPQHLVNVPDVTGIPLDAAKAKLEDNDLVYKDGGHRYDAFVPKGYVISQDPGPTGDSKQQVDFKSAVTLVVSDGPEETTPTPTETPTESPTASPTTETPPATTPAETPATTPPA